MELSVTGGLMSSNSAGAVKKEKNGKRLHFTKRFVFKL